MLLSPLLGVLSGDFFFSLLLEAEGVDRFDLELGELHGWDLDDSREPCEGDGSDCRGDSGGSLPVREVLEPLLDSTLMECFAAEPDDLLSCEPE